MEQDHFSPAEQRAEKAQTLSAFSNINLVGIRSAIKELLRSVGTTGVFNQYTRHDISHVDKLLRMLDWVVIPTTQEQMTPADWILLVLAVYLHDAGMIVTEAEYGARNDCPLFFSFRSSILDSAQATSYKERIDKLTGDAQELFLYQEFVRTYHPQRIKSWILGDSTNRYGIATEARSIVSELVSGLDRTFRDDLALVCESHHENNLDDLSIFELQKAYGSLPEETANLQFAAILLRTVDLLHVTKDRAPSIAFRLSTPSDPKSLEEWHKQMPVVSVRLSKPRDEQGVVQEDQLSDTVAVTATFTDPKGFFSLTEYLYYAETELKQSYRWAEQSRLREKFSYYFPWKRIDSTGVKAVNFESKQFVFELDKPKILRLLTGHTLYSNPDVVVRELVQNSLDATRLQFLDTPLTGTIALHIDSANRTFTIDDNGTGMSQQIIESHFLNVGSSRYSDEMFKKTFPTFSAISRFGIGILSTFMISDEIEVLTKSESDDRVKNISIRSLNGRYLIRSLEPTDASVPGLIRNHGTRIQLTLRAGVEVPDITQIAQYWILFPNCTVTTQVDSGPVGTVGYSSPKQALEAALERLGINLAADETPLQLPKFKVVQREKEGLQLAFALEWSHMYKVWNFLTVEKLINTTRQPHESSFPIAMCVQGIRVEGTSPGFGARTLVAVSNSLGMSAPATNVARSALEYSPFLDVMLSSVYTCLAEHVREEVTELSTLRGASVSAAASEGRFLVLPLQSSPTIAISNRSEELLVQSLKMIPLLTIDEADTRRLVKIEELERISGFWTIESPAFRSADDFIRRLPTGVSFSKLANLGFSQLAIPENIVSGYSEVSGVRDLFAKTFEVDRIEINSDGRQASFHWRSNTIPPRWRSLMPTKGAESGRLEQVISIVGQASRGVRLSALVYQLSDDVTVEGLTDEVGIKSLGRIFLLKGTDLYDMLGRNLAEVESGKGDIVDYIFTVSAIITFAAYESIESLDMRHRVFEQMKQQASMQLQREIKLSEEARAFVFDPSVKFFSPHRGDRNHVYLGIDSMSDYI